MRDRATSVLAGASWCLAATFYLASERLAASAFTPSYSYAHNYISDLGVTGCGTVFDGRPICSPFHAIMNASFVLQGLLFAVAAVVAARRLRTRWRYLLVGCAMLNGIGISLVGLFPETAGPLIYHALGAFMAIVFGNATALVSVFAFKAFGLPRVHRIASLILPAIAAVALSMLLAARSRGTEIVVPDGVWERASVYTITAWELLTAGCLALTLRGGGGTAQVPESSSNACASADRSR